MQRDGTGSVKCSHCRATMESQGIEKFRVGGTTGGWKLLFGEWAELGEGMLPMEVFVCPQCHKVELFLAGRR